MEHRYTAVKSCHDAGKSWVASRIAAWWIDSHPAGEAFIVSTAPTAAQVYAILWREITRAWKKGGLTGRILSAGYPQWKIDGELVGYGRKPNDYQESAFQGIHARYVLVIMDEACGIERSLFNAVDALATNEEARVLAIGNPDDPSSHFAVVCDDPNQGWNSIRIDGLRTPNMTYAATRTTPVLDRLMIEEQIPYATEPIPDEIRPLLLSPLWVEERLRRWCGVKPGEPVAAKAAKSGLFTSKVRGLFPDDNATGIIPLGWVERAIDRWRDWDTRGRPEPAGHRIIGVDVAYMGEDETAIAIRQGPVIISVETHPQLDTVETFHLVEGLTTHKGTDYQVIDVIGYGAGVHDNLAHAGYNSVPFNAAAGTKRTDANGEFRFRNCRAGAWWRMRELLDPSRGAQVMLPDDDQLKADLTATRWRVLTGGIIVVEEKAEIRKRLGRSTDSGDAVIQAFWIDGSVVDRFEGAAVPWTGPGPDTIPWDVDSAAEALWS